MPRKGNLALSKMALGDMDSWETDSHTVRGCGRSCGALPVSVPKLRPLLDEHLGPIIGPEFSSTTGAGVWRNGLGLYQTGVLNWIDFSLRHVLRIPTAWRNQNLRKRVLWTCGLC